jgi:hypothetical protein
VTGVTSLAKGYDPRYLSEGQGAGHAGRTKYYADAAGSLLGSGAARRRPTSASGARWTRPSSKRSGQQPQGCGLSG